MNVRRVIAAAASRPSRAPLAGVLLLVALGYAVEVRADVVAVVSARSPAVKLSETDVANAFLGKTVRLPDGSVAVPLDLAEGSPVRDEFYEKLLGKTPAQLKAYWSRLIFTGRGRPPREVPDAATVLKILRENPSAIGYIDRSRADASVRIVASR